MIENRMGLSKDFGKTILPNLTKHCWVADCLHLPSVINLHIFHFNVAL